MKISRFRRIGAAVALAVATMIALPANAHAVGSYPPNDSNIVSQPSANPAPGSVQVLAFAEGSFAPGEIVTFDYTGSAVSPELFAMLRTAPATTMVSTSRAAAGDGSLSFSFSLPSNATGTYTMQGSATDWSRTWVMVIPGTGTGAGAGSGLVQTGASDQLLLLWVAGGALAFIGGGALVFTAVRKQRKLAA